MEKYENNVLKYLYNYVLQYFILTLIDPRFINISLIDIYYILSEERWKTTTSLHRI